jgi:hypothetical protein
MMMMPIIITVSIIIITQASIDDDPAAASASYFAVASGKQFLTADKERNMEMEVTFNPSLDELSERLQAKSEKSKGSSKGETVWESYLRKQKDKKSQRKVSYIVRLRCCSFCCQGFALAAFVDSVFLGSLRGDPQGKQAQRRRKRRRGRRGCC